MENQFLFKLKNEIKNYTWGSHDAFKTLFHYKNEIDEPQAEIWMGTHPAGISKVKINGKEKYLLSTLISSNPCHYLGNNIDKSHSGLPFLFKVLAAERPLSIQVHPNKCQAEKGFAQENAANIPLDAPYRNYKDANHKPELIYALTPFYALNGFRSITEIVSNFERFDTPILKNELTALQQQPTSEQLKRFFKFLFTLSDAQKNTALHQLLTSTKTQSDTIAKLIQQLAKEYPNDIGVFMPLMLNHIELQPGQAMYLDAMTPHAYLRGVGLEIMASSDNVLRAGLTPKHMDMNELLINTKFESKSKDMLLTDPVQKGNQLFFPVPVTDFQFSIIQSEPHWQQQVIHGPEIVFCISGCITLKVNQESCTLKSGESVFIAAAAKYYTYSGTGEFARAFSGK